MKTRNEKEQFARLILAFVFGICIFGILIILISNGNHDVVVQEETTTSLTELTTTTTEVTQTTTEKVTTTTTTTTTSTTVTTTTTSITTTTTTTTTETSKLMTYDILQRIEIINILLDETKYERLIKKDPSKLTNDEHLELYYYNSLVMERKQLREYLDKNK
jgi:hypothetical protein